ncbi:DUF3108 domain-containing protein [Pseudolabrys sp. FHR47]|uniref:DUF3108 domain-containing protein n=1 Tax=Pseudolabrys sp. FHR47 TaxID=2562284 RepID=UPI0010BE84F6|nr:DUF3108 domain-containing protein [Pseudolabrys sp. FHR47]
MTLAAPVAALCAAFAPGDAGAQARLDARYTASLAGLPIGEGTWQIVIGEGDYSATAKGSTTGLMKAFTGGYGHTITQGTLQAGKPVLSSYTASIQSYKKGNEVSLKVDGGAVKDLKLDPPAETEPERVPVTEASKSGVLDPMTATLVRMTGNGDVMSPEACQRKLPVFDGRLRYDLNLAFKRMDQVKADKGYAGPVVVCSVIFTPVAGYIPTRAAIKYLQEQRNIEIWLAPIGGTRVLVPFRIEGPTPVGRAALEADEFVVTALPPKEPIKASIKPKEKDKPTKAAASETKPTP